MQHDNIIPIDTARRWRAMTWLITRRLLRAGYPDDRVLLACKAARRLYNTGHSAGRAITTALQIAARSQRTQQPNPNRLGE